MTLKGDQYAEIKEIIAKAISAGAPGLRPDCHQHRPLGSVSSTTTGSWQTALAQTVQAAGQVYGNQVLQSIKDDGVYIRVPLASSFTSTSPKPSISPSPPGVDPKSPQLKKPP